MRFPLISSSVPAAGAVLPAACTNARLRELQRSVNDLCKGGLLACKGNWNCPDLAVQEGAWQACAAARDLINNECFDGGDVGHQQAAADARRAADRCDYHWRNNRCNV